MKPLRLTRLISTIICIICAIVSLIITLNYPKLSYEWFTYWISIIIGVFSSALLVCVSSFISLEDKKRGIAYGYFTHFYQVKQNTEYLSLYLSKHQTATGEASIQVQSDPIMIEVFSSLSRELSEILSIERITPMSRKRYLRRKNRMCKNRLAFVEHHYKSQCAKVFQSSTKLLNELKRIPLYYEVEQIIYANQIIEENWDTFAALMIATGEYNTSCEKFEEKLLHITGKLLSDEEL